MASFTPATDLWLERSRLDGMALGAVSYGVLFLLTIQATVVLTRRPHRSDQTIEHRWILVGYVWITFVLATIGFAGNVRYTEMIWIDLRNAPDGPAALIFDELDYWINMMALTCYYIMEWFMQALLLYRCFVLWNWQKRIIIPMSIIFTAMVATSILVLTESGAVFYNIKSQLAYLCLQVGLTIIYTLFVIGRIYTLRHEVRRSLGREDGIHLYEMTATMVIESAAPYSILGTIFIISFALHSDISNLIFLSISHVQGIAQLLIIVRVAKGRVLHHSAPPSVLNGTPCNRDVVHGNDHTNLRAEDKSTMGEHV